MLDQTFDDETVAGDLAEHAEAPLGEETDRHEAAVAVSIYDVTGRLVRKLRPGRQAAGSHTLDWDGLDGHGASLPGGLYLFRINAGGQERACHMIKLN